MKNSLFPLLFSVLSFSLLGQSEWVNPSIGTGGHGHTYPGATAPFGMVQLSPDTRLDGWDGCGGYHYSDSAIYGFSHTHLSGTGVSDYGDLLLMPMLEVNWTSDEVRTAFSHKNEKANAGSYEVLLANDIRVELTASPRAGVHRYTFPKGAPAYLLVDLLHRDRLLGARSFSWMKRTSRAIDDPPHGHWTKTYSTTFAFRRPWRKCLPTPQIPNTERCCDSKS